MTVFSGLYKIIIPFLLLALFCFTLETSIAQTANITEGCAPLVVNFTAPGGASTYNWDFKDGSFSNLPNPTNTFLNPNTYVVEFNENGGSVTTVTIVVHAKPSPTLTSDSSTKGCVPLAVDIEANANASGAISVTNYQWAFGDGSGGSGINVNHTYTTPNVFDVSLELTTNFSSCNVTKIFPGYISTSTPPNTNFSTNPNPPLACQGPLTVSFNNTSTSSLPLTYEWNLGNGNMSTSTNPSAQTYITIGDYIATLTATDSNGCSKAYNKTITIGSPTSSFTMPPSACVNTTINTVNTSSSGNYLWNFGSGASPATSSQFQPTVSYSTPGNKTVTLRTTSSNGFCSHDTSFIINIQDPEVSFTINPTYSCEEPVSVSFNGSSPNTIVSWDWDFGDNTPPGTIQNPTHIYNIVDSPYSERGENIFAITLNVITNVGCMASAIGFDTIHLPWARFMPDTSSGCAPLEVTFFDSSRSNEPITDWEWIYDDGSSNLFNSDAPHSHTFINEGEYNVTLIITNDAGCKDTSYPILIEVGAPKPLDFDIDSNSICAGDTVQLINLTSDSTLIDGWHYSSSGDLLSHCADVSSPFLVFDDEVGMIDVTLTVDYNGCVFSETKPNLLEVKGPIADFEFTYDCADSFDIFLQDLSKGSTSIDWNLGDGNNSLLPTLTHTYLSKGDYTIILTASSATSGCPPSIDSFTLSLRTPKAVFSTDSLLCGFEDYAYNASSSIDVYNSCHSGYTWFFSDPSLRPVTTENSNKTFAFPTSGLQTISLVVEDVNGCKDTMTHEITVYNTDVDYSISDQLICLPDTILFSDSSSSDTTITNWNWNFGDASGSSSPTPGNHIYTSGSGSFTTSLSVTNAIGCTNILYKTINIYTPVSSINTNPALLQVCQDANILFSASDYTAQGSHLNFIWDFGDGDSSMLQNANHSYDTGGTYTARLSYWEVGTGCGSTINRTVRVQDYPNAGFFSDVDTQPVLCYPQIVNFTDTTHSNTPITFSFWDLDNNNLIYNNNSPTFVFDKGTHHIKLRVNTSYGCVDEAYDTLEVIGPEGDFQIDKNNICKDDSITFTIIDTVDITRFSWDFGDGTFANDVSPESHIYTFVPPFGQTVAKLTMYGENDICPVSKETDIFIREVIADFMRDDETDTAICLGQALTLTNTSTNANVYNWDLGDNNTSTSSSNFDHIYQTPGTYDIELGVRNSTWGCTDTIIKTIIIQPLPFVDAIGDTVCPDDPAQLNVTAFDPLLSYLWTPPDNFNSDTIHNPIVVPPNSKFYFVTVTDSNTCQFRDSAFVYVVPPLVGINFDTSVVVGDSAWLPADNQDGFIIFTWTPEDGLSCLDCSDPTSWKLEDHQYELFMEDKLQCSNATSYYDIHVIPETFIELPTTFSPNNDGINDIVYVEGWGIRELLYFQIYNRWGELLFETTNIEEGWNGYFNGVLQNNDIYVYKVKVLTWLDEEIFKEGHINLIR